MINDRLFSVKRRLERCVVLLLLVFAGATLGYVLMGWSPLDALYMVTITIFGVGYGEVRPVANAGLRIYTMLVIVGGTSAVVYVIGQFIRSITEGELMKALGEYRTTRKLEDLHEHIIVCGYGRLGQSLAKELAERRVPLVVVEANPGRAELAESAGLLCLRRDAIEEETLKTAGVERAAVLATVLPDDAQNVFIALTARNLNRRLRIIARGEQPSTEKKLLQAGADEVVLPAAIGGMRIAHSILWPSVMEFLQDRQGTFGHELRHFGVELDELPLADHGHLVGTTVAEVQRRAAGCLLVVALKRADGSVVKSGWEELKLCEGDALLVFSRCDGDLPAGLRPEIKEKEELL